MDGILGGLKSIFDLAVAALQDDVVSDLQEGGDSLSNEKIRKLESRFRTAANPFAGLETRYHQDMYLKRNLDYLVSHNGIHDLR